LLFPVAMVVQSNVASEASSMILDQV